MMTETYEVAMAIVEQYSEKLNAMNIKEILSLLRNELMEGESYIIIDNVAHDIINIMRTKP